MKSYKTILYGNAQTPVAHDNKFDSLYLEISRDWQKKAERLQQRRWQKIHTQEP
jgi:hypothetical protein